MAPLNENLGSKYCEKYGAIQTYQIGPACHIYAGATVVLNLSDGYVYPATGAFILTPYNPLVVGTAQEEIDNSGSTITNSNIRVRRDSKVLRTFNGSMGSGHDSSQPVGKLACVYDDQTVQLYNTSTALIVCGRITEIINASEVWVDFADRPQRTTSDVLD